MLRLKFQDWKDDTRRAKYLFCEFLEQGIVKVATNERTVRLHNDILLLAILNDRSLLAERMDLEQSWSLWRRTVKTGLPQSDSPRAARDQQPRSPRYVGYCYNDISVEANHQLGVHTSC